MNCEGPFGISNSEIHWTINCEAMGCCKTTTTWAQNLKVGPEYRQYTVQLVRDIGCICEEYTIFVNGHAIDRHGLTYNPCSPLCCGGGQYEWEQDGHSFLLIYNSLSWTNYTGGFRLFIDGLDVNTGREFSSFWRRRGWQVVFAGLVMLLLGITLSLVFHYAFSETGRYGIPFAYALVCCGVFYICLGLIPVFRYRKPRDYRSGAVAYTGNVVWQSSSFWDGRVLIYYVLYIINNFLTFQSHQRDHKGRVIFLQGYKAAGVFRRVLSRRVLSVEDGD